jgi:hypothetical protein
LLSRSGTYIHKFQRGLSDSDRPITKEPRGILLYSHSSTSTNEDLSNDLESTGQGAPDKGSSQDSSKVPPSDIAIEKGPGGSSDTGGIGSPSASQPDSTKKSTVETTKSRHIDKQQDTGELSRSFHVLTWLNEAQNTTLPMPNSMSAAHLLNPDSPSGGVNIPRSFILDEMSLRADLKEMDRFLKRQTSFEERLIYHECPPRTRHEAYVLLKSEGKEIAALTEKDPRRTKAYEDKVEIFNKAETLFQFFLPSRFEGRTIEKYWGAVYSLLVVSCTS